MNNSTFEEELSLHGTLVYTNRGISMMPLIRDHLDVLEIVRRREERLKKYDVVLFRRGEKYILHRIVKVKKDGYDVVGDHQYHIERDVTDSQIIGVLTRVIRDGKEIPLHGFKYWCYVRLWCWFYPLRALILRLENAPYAIQRRLKKSK